jgi:hypothetical protein
VNQATGTESIRFVSARGRENREVAGRKKRKRKKKEEKRKKKIKRVRWHDKAEPPREAYFQSPSTVPLPFSSCSSVMDR